MFHCANFTNLGGLDPKKKQKTLLTKGLWISKPVKLPNHQSKKPLVQDTPAVIKTERIVKNSHKTKMTSAKVPQTLVHCATWLGLGAPEMAEKNHHLSCNPASSGTCITVEVARCTISPQLGEEKQSTCIWSPWLNSRILSSPTQPIAEAWKNWAKMWSFWY